MSFWSSSCLNPNSGNQFNFFSVLQPLAAYSLRVWNNTFENGRVSLLGLGILDLGDEFWCHDWGWSTLYLLTKTFVLCEIISNEFLSLRFTFRFTEHVRCVGDHVSCTRHFSRIIFSLADDFSDVEIWIEAVDCQDGCLIISDNCVEIRVQNLVVIDIPSETWFWISSEHNFVDNFGSSTSTNIAQPFQEIWRLSTWQNKQCSFRRGFSVLVDSLTDDLSGIITSDVLNDSSSFFPLTYHETTGSGSPSSTAFNFKVSPSLQVASQRDVSNSTGIGATTLSGPSIVASPALFVFSGTYKLSIDIPFNEWSWITSDQKFAFESISFSEVDWSNITLERWFGHRTSFDNSERCRAFSNSKFTLCLDCNSSLVVQFSSDDAEFESSIFLFDQLVMVIRFDFNSILKPSNLWFWLDSIQFSMHKSEFSFSNQTIFEILGECWSISNLLDSQLDISLLGSNRIRGFTREFSSLFWGDSSNLNGVFSILVKAKKLQFPGMDHPIQDSIVVVLPHQQFYPSIRSHNRDDSTSENGRINGATELELIVIRDSNSLRFRDFFSIQKPFAFGRVFNDNLEMSQIRFVDSLGFEISERTVSFFSTISGDFSVFTGDFTSSTSDFSGLFSFLVGLFGFSSADFSGDFSFFVGEDGFSGLFSFFVGDFTSSVADFSGDLSFLVGLFGFSSATFSGDFSFFVGDCGFSSTFSGLFSFFVGDFTLESASVSGDLAFFGDPGGDFFEIGDVGFSPISVFTGDFGVSTASVVVLVGEDIFSIVVSEDTSTTASGDFSVFTGDFTSSTADFSGLFSFLFGLFGFSSAEFSGDFSFFVGEDGFSGLFTFFVGDLTSSVADFSGDLSFLIGLVGFSSAIFSGDFSFFVVDCGFSSTFSELFSFFVGDFTSSIVPFSANDTLLFGVPSLTSVCDSVFETTSILLTLIDPSVEPPITPVVVTDSDSFVSTVTPPTVDVTSVVDIVVVLVEVNDVSMVIVVVASGEASFSFNYFE
ncbi:hypothetical protein GCK72_002244 [Caenorhabditis remanei]|uniref:Uncharacterized protein n=1 Tax=Caenorhabditis remanei TaxID=31234 RepID=A0A6A5HUL7_CAERE|nr:hypothetical protein GCK72_002244 [Caenorhabditis remanei]KAF1770426.1 hypothetical protein GCK72_002244 [Caenorhabditis remanei]